MSRAWNLNLRKLEARQSVADQEARFGILNQTAPDRCCAMRKVEPLFAGLEEFDTWFTALRREQSPTRANLQVADDFKLAEWKGDSQGESAGGLDESRRMALSGVAFDSGAAVVRSGIYEHRMQAVHFAAS